MDTEQAVGGSIQDELPYIQGIWIVYRFDIDDVTIMNCGQHTFSADADRDFFPLRQRLERKVIQIDVLW